VVTCETKHLSNFEIILVFYFTHKRCQWH